VASHEISEFIGLWEHESGLTKDLLKSVPEDKYHFRPDPEGRSMGELAWHLAELEAIFSTAARDHNFKKIPGLERPELLHHLIHHRGQLQMMIRIAGAVPSRIYGPNREDTVAAGPRA
jgi:uncharacterized damage-inducible protein DinB